MGQKSKSKGSSFERKVCRILSLWVSNEMKEDLFWRSAMSGGRASRAAKLGKDLRRQAGDISAVAPEGHTLTDRFYIECKFVRNLYVERFIMSSKGLLADYWKQCQEEASKFERKPMLIAKQNQFPEIVLTQRNALLTEDIDFPALGVLVKNEQYKCAIMKLDDLLQFEFDPDLF